MPTQKTSGERLFDWILARYTHRHVSEKSWIGCMAEDFRMELIDFEELLLRSSSLMFLRRVIRNANWYLETFDGLDELEIRRRFDRDYLGDVLAIKRHERPQLVKLVFDAAIASQKVIPRRLRRSLEKHATDRNQRCEIGGCIINYSFVDTPDSLSLDHIWPRALGGESEQWNLRVACLSCNSQRKDLVDFTDVHYEHLHAQSDAVIKNPYMLGTETSNALLFAALMRAKNMCERCGTPVNTMDGKVLYGRRQYGENYNLFNIEVLCPQHGK